MQTILDWLSNEGNRDVIDYFLVIIPIIVSCIAIIISVSVSKKQNKIAMFNIRYTCISQMQTILNFAAGLNGCEEPKIILRLFDSLWGTNGTKKSFEENLIQYRCQLENIKKDVLQSEFVFKNKYKTDPYELVYALHIVVMDSINENEVTESVKAFTNKCNLFYEKDYKKLTRQTNIGFMWCKWLKK